ncbi:hypothetical protein H0H87_006310 [Tephrocybe sp. NHM501043]|nr:hypothetical protein H0H87_006310 [Tephrocybe sp. NHM501043]
MSSFSSFLSLPLTFEREQSNLLDISCSHAQPSVIRSWGHVSPSVLEPEATALVGGCAMGTQDGTLFLFKQTSKTGQTTVRLTLLSPESQTPSRPSTPTSPLPFNLSQRSRVVSGITTEQVEAPKNYVDFDEEPDKLKGILEGRQPKESRDRSATPVELSKPLNLSRSPTPSITGSSNLKRNAIPKSLLSVTNSAVFTTPSSNSPSPLESTDSLRLWCHVILPKTGPGKAVTRARVIEDPQLLVVLQETGDLSVISLEDGSSVATMDPLANELCPPEGINDNDSFQTLWFWNHLKVYEFEEV